MRLGAVPIEHRSERIVGEVLFPEPRRQLVDAGLRVGIDALQDIDLLGVGILIVEHARGEEALDLADVLGADLGPAEQPVFAAHRDDA